MSSLALQANLNSAKKIVYEHIAFLPSDRFYCCLNFSFQVRNTFGIVDTDIRSLQYPGNKSLGGLSRVNTVTTADHTCD